MKKLLFTFFCLSVMLTGFSQNDKTNINAGSLTLEPNIPKNPTEGTICWTGTEFLGFDGLRWTRLNGMDTGASSVPIKVWSYLFQFPLGFSLIPENDADLYAGTIEGAGITLDFEHSFLDELPPLEASSNSTISSNEIDGHSINITRPVDSQNSFTTITINKLIESTEVVNVEQTDSSS